MTTIKKRKYRRRTAYVAPKPKKPEIKFASNYEARVAKDLQTRGVTYRYEPIS